MHLRIFPSKDQTKHARPKYFFVPEEKIYQNYVIHPRANSANRPLTLYEALKLGAKSAGFKVCEAPLNLPCNGRSLLFYHSPGMRILIHRLFRCKYVYLCWGLPKQESNTHLGYLKLWRLKAILNHAVTVLVNDRVTKQDVAYLGVKNAIILPNFVDDIFFSFSSVSQRESFILAAGDVDRDEGLIVEIAKRSRLSVVRVTRDQRVRDFHQRSNGQGVKIKFRCSFDELRNLYQKAQIVIIPLLNNNHAAGQTSLLESVASGAPVVITAGRSSTIAERVQSVVSIPDQSVTSWLSAINRILRGEVATDNARRESRQYLLETHGGLAFTKNVSDILKSIDVS